MKQIKKTIYKNIAFTLVELIVVITILAILGTIAFISLNGYSKDSRDATRISDISLIKTSLELFSLDTGKYPETTNGKEITYSGGVAWIQGTFGKLSFNNIEKLNKIPTDPLSNNEYTYSVTKTRSEFQIGTIFESDKIASIIDKSYANGNITAHAYITGNYNGIVNKIFSGSTCYLLSIPTIIANDIETSTDLVEIINNDRLVYNGYKNLPGSYKESKFKFDGGLNFIPNKLLTYTDSDSCKELAKNENLRLQLLIDLQNSYSGTILTKHSPIKRLLNTNINLSNPSSNATIFAGNLINNYLHQKVKNITYAGGVSNSGVGNSSNINIPNVFYSNSGGGSDYDYGYDIKVDNSGNVYILAEYRNTINIFGETITNSGSEDTLLAKLDGSGSLLWYKTSSGINGELGRSLDLDNNGNIYIGGYFWGTTSIFGGPQITSAGNLDAFISKLDSNGNILWTKKAGGTNADKIHSISVDGNGNVYGAGIFEGNGDLFGSTGTGTYNFVKLDTNGNFQWSKEGYESTYVKSDNANNIYITGIYPTGSLQKNIYGRIFNFSSTYSSGAFLAKVDTTGNILWVKITSGLYTDSRPFGMDIGPNGNIYIVGWAATGGNQVSTATIDIFGNSISIISGITDLYVTKLNSDGNGIWVKKTGGTGSNSISKIKVGNDGKIHVIGAFSGVKDIFGQSLSATQFDSFVVQLDNSGNYIWSNGIYGSSNFEIAVGIDVDNNGNVYVIGSHGGANIFGQFYSTSGVSDIFYSKLSYTGSIN